MSNRYFEASSNDSVAAIPWDRTYAEKSRQKIQVAINTHRGEWFLVPELGLPWIEWLTERSPDLLDIARTISAEILKVSEVANVQKSVAIYDTQQQAINYTALVTLKNNDTIQLTAERALTNFDGINGTHLTAIRLQATRGISGTN